MLPQPSTFVIFLLSSCIVLLFTSVNGQERFCRDFCPEVVAGGWASVLRGTPNGTTVALLWAANTGAGGTEYVIQFRTENSNFTTSAPVEDVTTFILRGLDPVTEYGVQVCLVQLPMSCGGCLLCVTTGYDPVPPTQPSLTGSSINALAVELMWERPIGEITYYIIRYSPVNNPSMADFENVTATLASQVTHVVGGLSPNTTYQFNLTAGNLYGTSPPSDPITLKTELQSDSPGYLLVSDSEGISYYYTQAAQLETPGARADVRSLLSARRISGIGYYPINDTNGFIYTSSSDGLITRHTAVLDKTGMTLNVTANTSAVNRSSFNPSLISVDWLNDMLYWLETVNNTYSVIMYSMLNGSEMNCVTSIKTVDVNVTGIEVNPIHGYLYWSILGPGGGIFQLDLTLAKFGNCSSPATDVVRIVNDHGGTGINSMTLNLEDLLLYFAFNGSNLSSISLGERQIVNYTHSVGVDVDARSIVSYNEYLAVTARILDQQIIVLGLFVRILGSQGGRTLIRVEDNPDQTPVNHLYMIREEFQPLPVPPGPVNNVMYSPASTSINITWTTPQYPSRGFGPSAFNQWLYNLTLQSNNIATEDTRYQYSDLLPNTVYMINIFPSVLGAVGNVSDAVMSSWIVQTVDNVVPTPNIILATDVRIGSSIYTAMFSDRQAVQLDLDLDDSPSIGVTYDVHRNTIYWTNTGPFTRSVVRLSLSGGEPVLLHSSGNQPTNIGVDYIGQRLYWIESNSIQYILLESASEENIFELFQDSDITDLAVDSPSGLLFWTHNGAQRRGVSMLRLNGLGDRMICVSDNDQSFHYLAVTVDTENKRVFWIKETVGFFQIGVADYGSGSCINHVYKMIDNKPSIDSTSNRRVSMAYAAGTLLHTLSTSPNTVFITPSNFSSFPSTDYQLATGYYNISFASGDVNIRSIFVNQTSQQFLPDNVGLNVATVTPTVPSNIRLDDSSNATFINITWDIIEGISPAIMTYEVTYNLSRIDGSIENNRVLKTSNNYFVLEDQSPETTVNVSIRAYTRWYSSDMTPVVTLLSDSRLPSQIEQSSVSVFRGERGSDELIVLLTWTALTSEQAGGVLTYYIISLYNQPTGTLLREITVSQSDVLEELTDLMANQMYSFTVRAVNRAGSGNESEEVMFNTNGPRPPMELLAVDSEGVTATIRNSQPISMEAIRGPFTVDNRRLIVYYINSNNLMSTNLNILNSAELLLTSLPMISDLALDWVGRRIYIAQIQNTNLVIRALALDSVEMNEIVSKPVPSDTMVKITLSPYTGQLYWIEAGASVTSLNQLNLVNNTYTQLYPSNTRKRNVMCSQSGLDTIGELTAALTYDVITDHLWVSTVSGDIWSCDLSGCNCGVRVNGTTLVPPGETLIDIGLPTDSISLDSVNIYWSGPTGVFYVPRSDATMLSPLSDLNTSSIVTIDPGQQPLPVEMCLYPALTRATQPVPSCLIANTTSDSLSISWTEPQVTPQCQNQLYAFPTLRYNVTYHVVGFTDQVRYEGNIFSSQTTANGLLSFSNYNIIVTALNFYTPANVAADLNSVICITSEGRPSQVINLMASPASTANISITWQRPIASGTMENTLSYNISVNDNFLELLDNSTTMYLITNRTPGINYTIQVIVNNSLGTSDPVQTVSFTYPLPPKPELDDSSTTNVTALIYLDLLSTHSFLNISLELTSEDNEQRVIMLPANITYPSVAPLMLDDLLPVTNYNLTTLAVYPNDEKINSDSINFTTLDGVPGIPEISLSGFVLQWTKPRENGLPITRFTLRLNSSDEPPDTFPLNVNFSMMEFMVDLSADRRVTPGVLTMISLSASNRLGSSGYSRALSLTIPVPSDENEGLTTGVLIGIIVGASVFAFIVLIIVIVLCYCYRVRPKNYDYAFRVEVPYDMELRKLRLNQMRMANNDLYSPNYNPDDVETLKKFPRDRIKLEKLLGRGAFGEVWAGTAVDIMGPGTGPHPVALKTLQKNATESDQRSFLSEAIVMSNFDHPNVLPVLGVCLNNNPFFLILELMEAGDLLAFLRGARQENGPPLLTVEELVKIALDVANGARYLETQHFVHRDLAARNCLVSSKGPDRVVKIGDFGLARDVYHSDYYRKEGQGLLPVRWMAPESLLDGKFTVDSDIWSYGILLWEITTLGRQPYPARSNQEVFQFVIGGGRCEKPDNCHPKLYRLIRQCWQHRPEERPRFTVLVDTLTRLHERLVEGNESTSSEESEFEDEEPRYTIQPRGSGGRRSLRSSIRSGASNIVTGIVNLTRAGSMRMRNSIRRQGSLRRQEEINEARAASSINRGRSVSSSEQQLLEPSSGLDHLVDDSAGDDQSMNNHTKEQNGFREIGPF